MEPAIIFLIVFWMICIRAIFANIKTYKHRIYVLDCMDQDKTYGWWELRGDFHQTTYTKDFIRIYFFMDPIKYYSERLQQVINECRAFDKNQKQ